MTFPDEDDVHRPAPPRGFAAVSVLVAVLLLAWALTLG